jgi:apolipoprotein N-acyltransferase
MQVALGGPKLIAMLCALLSAAGFYFSLNLGEVWPLAWLAPIPILWLAFGETRRWPVFFAAWAAYALGSTNLLAAYAESLPVPVLIIALTLPSLIFAGSVMGAQRVARNIDPLAGVLAFAVLWTAWDYVASLGPDGTAPSPSYSQVGAPYLIQGASVFGLWIVTFLIGLVSAGFALSLRTRRALPGVLAIAAFAANAGFGVWRMAEASPA